MLETLPSFIISAERDFGLKQNFSPNKKDSVEECFPQIFMTSK